MTISKNILAASLSVSVITGIAVAETPGSNEARIAAKSEAETIKLANASTLTTERKRKKKKCYPPYETKECPLKPFTK